MLALPSIRYASIVFGLTLLAAGLTAGCTGISQTVHHTNIAEAHLASERTVPYHPDSLVHVQLAEDDGNYTVDTGYLDQRVWQNWSTARHLRGGALPQKKGHEYRSFATLRSLDLALTQLNEQLGLSDLTQDVVNEQISQQIERHQSYVSIDVYTYGSANRPQETWLARPGRAIALHDHRGESYEPAEVDATIPKRTRGTREEQATVFRRTTFVFERFVDEGRDLLNDSDFLQLTIQGDTVRARDQYHYTWKLPSKSLAKQ